GGYTVITGTGTDGQGWINVSLVNPADIKNGTVQLAWTRDIGAATDEQYSIKMEVDGYYTDLDYAVVTVYKPSGDFVTAGGYIKTTQPSGLYAPDPGSRTNFGFNVKYGNGGKNLKGNMNIIFRRTVNGVLRTFQMKANAMTSLGVNITNPDAQTAVFVSKANLQDITNSNAPISVGGNLTVQVNMTDRGEPGSTDGIGIQLWNGTSLWYSSHLLNNDTKEMYLSGGNLKVVSSFNVGTVTPPAPMSMNNRAQESLVEAGTFNLKAYPNPAVSQFTLKVESDNSSDKISLRVFDLYGKTVQIFNNVVPNSTMRFGETYIPGVYFIEMIQGNRRMQLKLMKQSD
ncbi:MAG TPA: T9SS type A sorting domain-containing protein, partial [Flavitalea sp.]|nr:T9SS type A sorting domain-containing protein [Flavitalea sp.]